jgi:acetyl esterase/lipase
MTRLILSAAIAVSAIAAACGSDDDPAGRSFTEASDIVYMTVDGSPYFLDVYTPVGDGPWPVVVAFHGLSSAGKDAGSNTVVAEAAAGQGMLVVAPTWLQGDPFPLSLDDIARPREIAACAVAVAQDEAAARGGDPRSTVVYGFSAGTEPAILAALAPLPDPIPGCETDGPPAPVRGAVLGDGEYFLHSAPFDAAFGDDPDGMRTQVALRTDPTSWAAESDATFALWAASSGTGARAFDDPWSASGWLAARDPTGSIRADLDRLGTLDDGDIDYVDTARFLEFRLSAAGFDVSLEVFPGGHETSDKVPELVALLQAVASG